MKFCAENMKFGCWKINIHQVQALSLSLYLPPVDAKNNMPASSCIILCLLHEQKKRFHMKRDKKNPYRSKWKMHKMWSRHSSAKLTQNQMYNVEWKGMQKNKVPISRWKGKYWILNNLFNFTMPILIIICAFRSVFSFARFRQSKWIPPVKRSLFVPQIRIRLWLLLCYSLLFSPHNAFDLIICIMFCLFISCT